MILGVLGMVLVGVALRGLVPEGAAADRAEVTRSPTAAAPSSPPASSTATAAPKLPPVRLSIPAIGVSQNLLRLGLNTDRSVQVPTSEQADQPGWFRLGPAPGQMGSSVILGHVDSVRGPAVFYRLRDLKSGDRVNVELRDGAVAHYTVQRVATYPNERFPARKVYAPRGYPALQLVTCGGAYDQKTGYTANVVAYTRLVGTTAAGDRP